MITMLRYKHGNIMWYGPRQSMAISPWRLLLLPIALVLLGFRKMKSALVARYGARGRDGDDGNPGVFARLAPTTPPLVGAEAHAWPSANDGNRG
jgi:hypothetical protein